MIKKQNLGWNFFSGLVAPICTVIAVIILINNRKIGYNNALYLVPFFILTFTVIAVFCFWLSYYLYLHKKISLLLLRKTAQVVIIAGFFSAFLMVLQISLYCMAHLFDFTSLQCKKDSIYYIVSFWAFLELIHHFFYKLMFGEQDSFIELIKSTKISNFRKPVGGAIGMRARKLLKKSKNSMQ